MLNTRATVYFDPKIHKALKIKAAETSVSLSELVNQAIKIVMLEDASDLQSITERKKEKLISYETFVKSLKKDGKI